MNAPARSITGAVLIGGKSSRMGQPKHELKLADGRPMLAHVIAALAAVCDRVALVDSYRPGNARGDVDVVDRRPGAGPLGGIEALLASGIDPAGQYLVCPCDVPLMSPEVLRYLLSASSAPATIVRLMDRDEPESLPARINAAALPTVRTLLDTGQCAVWRLMQALPADIVPIPSRWARCFTNINSPEDLQSLMPQQ